MDIIEAYLEELKLFRSPKTVKNYRSHLTNFHRYVGKPLDHVSRDEIINYLDYLLNEKKYKSYL
ncbi:hypothetical protein CUJ83_08440 [Methanocella sp. CWC-04]|uniref:Core-binding (CB) domain-containing protein n=1 Tax=Methanooceanicella nereidis TaxID=2052831 RepID=A0AAP2RCR9_9EURY|nr:site-specific integrase [Methanocella sp. CWC-04]MCD1295023.1 hypothetical protein [Methanocella sp. CWC-04]